MLCLGMVDCFGGLVRCGCKYGSSFAVGHDDGYYWQRNHCTTRNLWFTLSLVKASR